MARWLFLILTCGQLAFAAGKGSTMPWQNSPLDERGCALRIRFSIHSSLPPIDEITCSGTMINSHVFLTAAHCFNMIPPPLTSLFYVQCPGGRNADVREIFVHPGYDGKIGEGEIDPSIIRSRNSKFDAALVVTSRLPISQVAFAKANESDQLLNRNECQILGYSPLRCDTNNKNCAKAVPIDLHGVTRDFINSKSVQLEVGDSGAGLFCSDNGDRHKFVGIAVSEDLKHGYVRLENIQDFIRTVLAGNYPKPRHYSQNYLETIQNYIWLKLALGQGVEKSNQVNIEHFTRPFSIYNSVLSILRTYMEKHPELIKKMRDEKIGFQIYDAKQINRQAGETKSIEKNCFHDGRTCWINILSDLTIEQATVFFQAFY